MGTYHWTSAQNVGDAGGTTDPTTAWLTPEGLANRVLSVSSYSGEGDVLVRTEVSANIWAATADLSDFSFFTGSAVSQFIGDVGIHDGETLDPSGDGAYEFAFTWDGIWDIQTSVYNWTGGIVPSYMRCTTSGYVTSKARRGPDKYGAISPAFNLSVLTHGSEYYPHTTESVSSSWVITARCLWFTP